MSTTVSAHLVGTWLRQAASELSEDEIHTVLGSDGFRHLVAQQKAARDTYEQTSGRGLVQVIAMTEVWTPSRKDENGRAYFAYGCIVCGTKVRIRHQKRASKKKADPKANQLALPQVFAAPQEES